MIKCLCRPSDVARIYIPSIIVNPSEVRFRVHHSKGAKLIHKPFSPFIATSDNDLITLFTTYKDLTAAANSDYLFHNPQTLEPLNPETISNAAKQLLLKLNIDINPGQLRKQGSSNLAHSGVPLRTILRTGTWRKETTFIKHYLLPMND